MDSNFFDRLTEAMHVHRGSRRTAVCALIAAGWAGIRGLELEAKKKTKKKGKKKKKKSNSENPSNPGGSNSGGGGGGGSDSGGSDSGGGASALPDGVTIVLADPNASGLSAVVPRNKRVVATNGYNNPQVGLPCDVGVRFPDHCNNQQFGLDLQTDASVLMAAEDGTVELLVTTAFGKLATIRLDDGNVNLNLGHLATASLKVNEGDRVVRGQCLGSPNHHIHVSLDDRYNRPGSSGANHPPIPFTGAYAIQGKGLPWDGETVNQWARTSDRLEVRSNNAASCPAVLQVEAAVRDPETGANIVSPRPNNRFISIAVRLSGGGTVHRLSGTARYREALGAYAAALPIGNGIALNQDYSASVKFDDRVRTLWSEGKDVTLRAGERNAIRVALVPGDADNDGNSINILDYNQIIACYGPNYNTCSEEGRRAADLNDDGAVNEFDYNLWLRVARWFSSSRSARASRSAAGAGQRSLSHSSPNEPTRRRRSRKRRGGRTRGNDRARNSGDA